MRNGRVRLVLKTLLGRVEYDRQPLGCPRCGLGGVPAGCGAGAAAGERQHAGGAERALWAATEVSYLQAAAFLAKFAGLTVSHGSAHRWAQEEGAVRAQEEAAAQEQVFGRHPRSPEACRGAPTVLYLQMDGTMGTRAGRRSEGVQCGDCLQPAGGDPAGTPISSRSIRCPSAAREESSANRQIP